MSRRNVYVVVITLVLLFPSVIFLSNYINLQSPLSNVLSDDVKNKGIKVHAHYQSYLNPDVIVFDLRKVSFDKSALDVTRVFLQFAEALQDKDYESVILSYKGNDKFQVKGEYFKKLGKEYDIQNPTYTIRTMPENIYYKNGERAYDTWTGGMLGVLNRQLEDFNDFHDKWYKSELLIN